jgi:hypothetical protein
MRERARVRGKLLDFVNCDPLIRPLATFSLREKGYCGRFVSIRIFIVKACTWMAE